METFSRWLQKPFSLLCKMFFCRKCQCSRGSLNSTELCLLSFVASRFSGSLESFQGSVLCNIPFNPKMNELRFLGNTYNECLQCYIPWGRSSSSRPKPAPDRFPFNIQILAQFLESCHGCKQTHQLQQLYNGLIFCSSILISSLHMWEHVVAVRVFYHLFGSWPCPRSHKAVLSCATGPKIALEG